MSVIVADVYTAVRAAPIAYVDRDALVQGLTRHGHRRAIRRSTPTGAAGALIALEAKPGDVVVLLGKAKDITSWAYALPGQLEALGNGGAVSRGRTSFPLKGGRAGMGVFAPWLPESLWGAPPRQPFAVVHRTPTRPDLPLEERPRPRVARRSPPRSAAASSSATRCSRPLHLASRSGGPADLLFMPEDEDDLNSRCSWRA